MTALTTVHKMTKSQRALVTVVVVVAAHAAVLALLATMKPIKLQRIEPPKPIEVKFVQLAPPPPPPPPPKPKPEPKPKEVKVVQQMPKPLPKPKPKPVIATTAVSDKPQVVIAEQPAPQPKPKEEPVIEQQVEKVEKAKETKPAEVTPKQIQGIAYIRQPKFDYDNDTLKKKSRSFKLRVIVNGEGKMEENPVVVESTGLPALDRELIRAAKKATFRPYKENGVGIPVTTVLNFELTLNDE